MDRPRRGGWGRVSGGARGPRLPCPHPISQISESGRRDHTRPFRFVSIPRQTSCSDPRKAHDPENMGKGKNGNYIGSSCCGDG
jgi:hypothetical protein